MIKSTMGLKSNAVEPLFYEEAKETNSVNKNDNCYFYFKDSKREIVPCLDKDKNLAALKRLKYIFDNYDNIPKFYWENKDKVKLYDPKGNVETANSILINPEDGAFHINNKVNDLTGKEWTKFTCSFFVFNALASDLKEEREVTQETQSHPATFSPTMVSDFIKFFTKEGDNVFDPFAGIGSTLVACRRTGRVGYGTELNPKYYNIILKRTPEFRDNIFNADCRSLLELGLPKIKYSISSPPYWDMLQRSTDGFKKERESKNLDVQYSNSQQDLGNINDYETFLNEVCSVYLKMYELMEYGGYLTIIVKNVKKSGRLYPLAWDIAKKLGEVYVLKDEKIWIQDKIGLSPYGYPYSWVSNILHHYCLVLRKE